MTDKVIENNQVTIMGEIVSDFTYSHEIFGEGFYMVDISVDRLSDSTDRIPVMVSGAVVVSSPLPPQAAKERTRASAMTMAISFFAMIIASKNYNLI